VAWLKTSCCLSNGSDRTASRMACSTDIWTYPLLLRIRWTSSMVDGAHWSAQR
jgi:hypothetical protein